MNSSVETTEPLLPKGFEDLAPYLDWALPHQAQRAAKRMSSTIEECRAVYDALTPRMEDLICHLEKFPYGEPLDAAHERLFNLGRVYVEVALPVEFRWKTTINEGSFPASRVMVADRR